MASSSGAKRVYATAPAPPPSASRVAARLVEFSAAASRENDGSEHKVFHIVPEVWFVGGWGTDSKARLFEYSKKSPSLPCLTELRPCAHRDEVVGWSVCRVDDHESDDKPFSDRSCGHLTRRE